MSSRIILLLSVLLLLAKPSVQADDSGTAYNSLVLEAIRSMPSGGGYSAGSFATHALENAVSIQNGALQIQANQAMPSYCSGATYLVFLKVIAHLQTTQPGFLNPEVINALRPSGQPDGVGIWGRWNANGPGTARLFYELELGSNFTDPSLAQPGDFLKIFWNDGIGATEHGHSVIYLGMESREGVPYLRFWSSNLHMGYGEKSVPVSRIHRMLFSRLNHPENLIRFDTLPHSDPYLSSLQRRSSSAEEMDSLCGVR